ncbi:glycosyltransferase family 4 protein [Synechococcus sp. A10-1-5-1]|uniref:glycosyltransferase family 4 protein n=1 Tax=Synechococcus sp. A10-1-5-1 TaxID=2936507 RepID=UPI0020016CA3|nr:glycosyltransferase family 1 protein [Synechococcus sp. A10-1-5-1]UPM49215.1 glycosyltransferase family 4 protein [Synechococcus sp. A10-1-5-1]
MKPLKVAVILDQPIRSGGGFQQALNAVLLVKALPATLVDPLFVTTVPSNLQTLSSINITPIEFSPSRLTLAFSYIRRFITEPYCYNFLCKFYPYSPFEHFLRLHDVDLVYFLSPSSWSNDLDSLNFIITLWDLSHRDDPEFPEVRNSRQFHHRERIFRSALPRATAVLVDSSLGKHNAERRYGLDESRVHVVPFEESPYLSGRLTETTESVTTDMTTCSFSVPETFIFYPAQFWPHKNHIYILRALSILREQHNVCLPAVFVGGDKGNLSYIRDTVRSLALEDQVIMPGFVSSSDITFLYKNALALVMPTYFGPTNLPPLEALSMGTPLIYSGSPSLSAFVAGAALLVDLNDPSDLAAKLSQICTSPLERSRLSSAGLAFMEKRRQSLSSSLLVLQQILQEFRSRRSCWR